MIIKRKISPFLFNHHPNPINFHSFRTFIANLELKFVADRGLDHAVEKEKDLKCVLNLKNLLKIEPSKSLSLSSIVDNIEKLEIPSRAIDFIRKYPSIFEEYFPASIAIHPHVRLTPESLDLDAEEQLIYASDLYRKNAADRLLKLLMLCRINEIPLKLIDRFKWDLGFPDNYVDLLVPEFPDYFRVKKGDNGFLGRSNRVGSLLELVCWNDELAVSVVEKRAMKEESGYQKGAPISFPLQFSSGFVMDKGMKKWVDEWQRLPYVSPYENAFHLQPNDSDMFDKWVVAVLHELLHIFVTKKTERDNLLCFGEYLGVKSRFKRALAHHPGIFYRSSKIGTHTMVLREGYKRGLLIDKNPLIDMRNKYIHLMHKVKEVKKVKNVPSSSASKQEVVKKGVNEKGEDNANGREEAKQFSDADVDESSEEGEEEDEVQVENSKGRRKHGRNRTGKVFEDGRKLGEVRGRVRRNASRDVRGDEDGKDRVDSYRGGGKNGRRGSGKVYEDRRKNGEERGRSRRISSRGKDGDDHEDEIESSRGARSYGRRGSGKGHEGRRMPRVGHGRLGRSDSRDRLTQNFSIRT